MAGDVRRRVGGTGRAVALGLMLGLGGLGGCSYVSVFHAVKDATKDSADEKAHRADCARMREAMINAIDPREARRLEARLTAMECPAR
ncbi:hypothetical protein CKO38_03005 [Rhodospirillum rubrum]|uniref:hypothetical protein n=1 Tax=Rhodospirillum rubrum TaxID=1085 RepID=UPI001EC687B7|nr:hypothetical protein [Rhodospirillum rubrum]MBK1663539.1 hypothetical protein [Rhodospirillum rubrum]MBK1675660.1 hypothetical protein [Rhodospirillum rubrum]